MGFQAVWGGYVLRRKYSLIIIMIGCIILTSCGSIKNTIKDNEIISKMDTEIDEKYSSYIDIDILIKGKLKDSMEYYYETFGKLEDMKLKDRLNIYTGDYFVFMEKKIEKDLDNIVKNPLEDEMKSYTSELNPKLKELIYLLEEMDSYYKLKSYVDDDFVKGKELHKQIISKYDEVKPLADKYSSNFNLVFIENSKKELENFKKKDFMINYYFLSSILRAKDIETELSNQNISSKNVRDLDIVKYKEKYNLLVEDMNRLLEYSKDGDRVKKEKLEPTFSITAMECIMDVKAAATDILIRAQKENKTMKEELDIYGREKFGTPDYLSSKVNDAVSEYIKIR